MPKRTADANQKIIKRVDANMKAEGFHATPSVKRDCIAMLEGKISADKLIGCYVAKHTRVSS